MAEKEIELHTDFDDIQIVKMIMENVSPTTFYAVHGDERSSPEFKLDLVMAAIKNTYGNISNEDIKRMAELYIKNEV